MSLLTRYEPRTLSTWLDDVFTDDFWFAPRALNGNYPAVEVREEDDHFRLTAEMPGLTKNDVHVSVKNGVLTLSGEKKHEKKEEKKGYYYSERSYGAFERSFNLGENVSEENVDASFKDGVLEIRLKKIEEKRPKEIEVK